MTTPRTSILSRVLLAGAALAASAVVSFRWCYEADLWWHLAHGREIAAGVLPRVNLFSFTHPDFPQPSISWLFDLGLYGLWQTAGATGIQLGQTLVLFATLALLFAACRERSSVAASAAVVTFGFFILEPRALPRPHTLSFAGMAACLFLIERAQARRAALPLLLAVPLVVAWSNFHVESVFGVALLGCFALGTLIESDPAARPLAWRATAVTALAAAAVLANPYGFGLVQYLIDNASVPEVIRIAELQPPYLPNYAPFFVYLLALGGIFLVHTRSFRVWEALAAGLFAILALRHLRFTPLLLCTTAPFVAARLGPELARARWLPVGALCLGLLTARLEPATFVRQLGAGIDSLAPAEIVPRGATAFARRVGLSGPLFNSMNIGGWVIWEMYPDARVFHDSRLQAYPAQHFRDTMAAYRSQPQWNARVAGVEWAMLSVPRPNELSGAGRFPAAEWATIYWDDAAEIVVRRTGRFASLVAEHEYRVLRPGFDPFTLHAADVASADRLVGEVLRNRQENPAAFAPAAWLCLHGGDAEACDAAQVIAATRPDLRRAALRLERRAAAAAAE